MGSGSSRMAVRSPRPRLNNRPKRGIASFICGGGGGGGAFSSSHRQMEDEAPDELVIPARLHDSVANSNLQYSIEESLLSVSPINGPSSTAIGHQRSKPRSNDEYKDHSTLSDEAETSYSGNCFPESKDLVPSLASEGSGLVITHPERTCDLPSTSSKLEHIESLLTTTDNSIGPLRGVDDSTVDSVSHTSSVSVLRRISQLEPEEDPTSVTSTTENPSNEILGVHGMYSNLISAASTSSLNLSGDEVFLGTTTSTADHVTLGERSGNVLHIDVVSISSNVLPSGYADINNNESRRNSRGLFWDAFSRRSTRRNYDSAALFSSAEDTDDLGSHDRWLLDISDDLFGSRFDHDPLYLCHRSRGTNGRRWHSRSEIRERLLGSFDRDSRQTTFCPSGLHTDGTCSCNSLLAAEELSTRASISRIVLLAEALFEILDEIHRRPVSLSLSMVSLPAPESVVNSLPLKSHRKQDTDGITDDVDQCYICLSEYEEADKIRVLPCYHEYHMACIDKWLKEIHGVCPLCRRNVCGDTTAL